MKILVAAASGREVVALSGIRFVVNAQGARTAVVIDRKKFGDVQEGFYDALIAQSRAKERRESLASVRRRLRRKGKLRG